MVMSSENGKVDSGEILLCGLDDDFRRVESFDVCPREEFTDYGTVGFSRHDPASAMRFKVWYHGSVLRVKREAGDTVRVVAAHTSAGRLGRDEAMPVLISDFERTMQYALVPIRIIGQKQFQLRVRPMLANEFIETLVIPHAHSIRELVRDIT